MATAQSCAALAQPTRTISSIPGAAEQQPPQHLILLALAATANICSMRLQFARRQPAFSFTVEAKAAGAPAWRTLFAEPEAEHSDDVHFAFGRGPLVQNLTHVRLRIGVGPASAPNIVHLHLSGMLAPEAAPAPSGSAWLDAMRAQAAAEPIFRPGSFEVQYNGAPLHLAFSDLSSSQASSDVSNIGTDGARQAIELRRDPAKWGADNSPRFFVGGGGAEPRGSMAGSIHTDAAPRPRTYRALHLLGGSLEFTVDVSQVGCSCIAAVYLVSMPARDADGARVLGPESYCDAVGWNGCALRASKRRHQPRRPAPGPLPRRHVLSVNVSARSRARGRPVP